MPYASRYALVQLLPCLFIRPIGLKSATSVPGVGANVCVWRIDNLRLYVSVLVIGSVARYVKGRRVLHD